MSDTRDKILDAAEKMFAELGIDGASLRAITDAAGVNLGSIHYYFKTKDQLVAEVLVRRINQFNREGVTRLMAMQKYDLRPSPRSIWLVMVGSMLELRNQHQDYLKFVRHMLVFREQMTTEIFMVKTDELEKNLFKLLSIHFSDDKREQALKRCKLVLELLHQAVLNFNLVKLSFKRSGIQLDDVQFAEQFADMAVEALSEFMET